MGSKEPAPEATAVLEKHYEELKIKLEGTYVPISRGRDCVVYYLFEYSCSNSARGAKRRDFILQEEKASNDKILPPAPTDFTVIIEFDFILLPAAVKRMSGHDHIVASLKGAESVTNELALNSAVIGRVERFLHEKKIVPMIKGGNYAANFDKFPLYHRARPDFMICVNLLGVVVLLESNEDEDEPLETLTGFITENKCASTTNHVGQLLGSMEKLSGDIAAVRLRANEKFGAITIHGLLVSYSKKEARPYLLNMDFKSCISTLQVGHELELAEAFRRLLYLIVKESK